MFNVRRDIQEIVYNKPFDNNQIITSNLDCNQLCRLKTALDKKKRKRSSSLVNWKLVILHHDNACPHTAESTKNLWEELTKFFFNLHIQPILLILDNFGTILEQMIHIYTHYKSKVFRSPQNFLFKIISRALL